MTRHEHLNCSELSLAVQNNAQETVRIPSRQQEVRLSKIRVKKLNFMQSPATAIYFSDATHQLSQHRLENQIHEEKKRIKALETYTSTISHEFRTPIGTSLMFLESLLSLNLSEHAEKTIKLVIQKLNLLLSLVQDILDIKMIQNGEFQIVKESFDPYQLLKFIVQMFKLSAENMRTEVSF